MELIKQQCKAIIELCEKQNKEQIILHTERIIKEVKKKNV